MNEVIDLKDNNLTTRFHIDSQNILDQMPPVSTRKFHIKGTV